MEIEPVMKNIPMGWGMAQRVPVLANMRPQVQILVPPKKVFKKISKQRKVQDQMASLVNSTKHFN
jgi:hypothetical protein